MNATETMKDETSLTSWPGWFEDLYLSVGALPPRLGVAPAEKGSVYTLSDPVVVHGVIRYRLR